MATSNPAQSHPEGRLVALEGDIETIALQLGLLPPSKKILILPSLLESLPQLSEEEIFDARIYVRDVHTVFTTRIEAARAFLASSTTTHPRMVFMNGGSVRARATCISKIAQGITNGDADEAEELFNEIVQDGVAGLMRHATEAETEAEAEAVRTAENALSNDDSSNHSSDTADLFDSGPTEEAGDGDESEFPRDARDPTVTAMQAAESLDRETETLDENSDGKITNESRNLKGCAIEDSALEPGENEESNASAGTVNASHRETIGAEETGDAIRTTVLTLPSATGHSRGSHPESQWKSESSKDIDDNGELSSGLLSPVENLVSAPTTPRVEYGEACIVDVQSAEKQRPIKKTKSVDRFFPSLLASQRPSMIPRALTHSISEYSLQPRFSTPHTDHSSDKIAFQTLPRTTFVRASETTIKKSPTTSSSESSASLTVVTEPRVFTDRATDANEPASPTVFLEAPFQPVFGIVEDLVITFTPQSSNVIFESVITSYKLGTYPKFPKEVGLAKTDSVVSQEPYNLKDSQSAVIELDPNQIHEHAHEFDPYGDDSYPPYIKKPRVLIESTHSPAHKISEKFFDFSPIISNDTITVQNEFRQLLSVHLPTSKGYSQHNYAASQEAERLWKPVFGNREVDLSDSEARNVDQIVALGCDEGVKGEFLAQISGQIERFGIKKDGVNRSGKLDIRYLIAKVLDRQTDSMSSSQDQLLSNPQLLAILLIPELELFLAMNSSTRLLIVQYTFDHLATILALRQILGGNLLNMCGILDTLSSDPPSFASPTRKSLKNLQNALSNDSIPRKSHRHFKSRSSEIKEGPTKSSSRNKTPEPSVSFSKANHLLPSTATDAEIAIFLSSIWKTLMEISEFYTPEPEPEPKPAQVTIEKPPQTPKSSREQRDSGYPPSSYRPPRTDRESKVSRLTGNTNPPSTGYKYAPSIASTTRTTASERGRREERAWENFYIAEEDSEDDAYDRMILGRGYAKIVPEVKKVGQKRNTKKALKWLGLA